MTGVLVMKKYIKKFQKETGAAKRKRRKEEGASKKGTSWQIFPKREQEQSREEYLRQNVILSLKYGVFALTVMAVLRGVLVAAGANVSVSNSVDGRELPIYCVETQEKKIAISFDAAWGNEDTAKILSILQKNDVRATFFMTGGWVLE